MRLALLGILPALLIVTVVSAMRGGSGLSSLMKRPSEHANDRPVPMTINTRFAAVKTPRTLDAAEAGLGDEEPIIGVAAGGRFRAYSIKAMSRPADHIINDVLGGVPVTATHCDIARCSRAFTGPQPGKPLDLNVAGMYRSRILMIEAEGQSYRQDTLEPVAADSGPAPPRPANAVATPPPFPFPDHPITLTTWGEWRGQHPETDVYVGNRGG